MIKTRLFSLSGLLDPAIHVAIGHTPYAEIGMSDRLRRKRPSGQAHACPHRNMDCGVGDHPMDSAVTERGRLGPVLPQRAECDS